MLTRRLITICVLGALTFALSGCDPEKAAGNQKAAQAAANSMQGTILIDDLEPSGDPIKMAPDAGDEVAVMETDAGRIVLMFHPEVAPDHVAYFKNLISEGFYDGTRFHRVIPTRFIQGGDPKSKSMDLANYWGTGDNVVDGRIVRLAAELSDVKHVRGVLSMARGYELDTASSQFFIMHERLESLDNKYTAFGRVVEGLDVVDKIVKSPTKDPDSGIVFPSRVYTIEKVTIETWPLE